MIISFIVTLCIFKAPRLIVQQSYKETFDTKAIVKGLLAQANTSEISLEEQSLIDEQAVQLGVQPTTSRIDNQQKAESCIAAGNNWSDTELMD